MDTILHTAMVALAPVTVTMVDTITTIHTQPIATIASLVCKLLTHRAITAAIVDINDRISHRIIAQNDVNSRSSV